MSGLPYRIGLLCWIAIVCAFAAENGSPVSIHPDNSKYFLFRGKPTFLLSATEHYGSVLNRAFDFEKYLNDAAEHKMTMTRTFLLFRELQGARNPASPAKPDSPDYLAPFPRTGPGKAMDGEPLYDLDQWNPEYFDRLQRFLRLASQKGIIVELTLFSNTYSDKVWELNPFRAKNNKQGVGKIEWPDYTSLRDRELVRRQSEYARKIIGETAVYDNIYYEICNEPGGGIAGHVSPAEVDAWQEHIASVMRDALAKSGRKHLIAGQQAFAYTPKFRAPYDQSFRDRIVDIVNVHPLPDTVFGGRAYQLGNFMSKELMLGEFADFTRAVSAENKPMVHDEDNAASMYRDSTGWTIHRKRAWTALFNAAHYDYIDFSITVGSEAGTPASRAAIRSWMRHLSEFMSGFDFIHSRARSDWIQEKPEHVVVSALVSQDHDYAAYLADAREVAEAGAGQPIGGNVALQLPAGNFAVTLFSPATGETLPATAVKGGPSIQLKLLPFRDDIVIRAIRTAE
jgi:hypothetical protein